MENTIYCYDGISANIPNKLAPNFEVNNEIEKSLPKLREAFVEKNIYLPEKSYDKLEDSNKLMFSILLLLTSSVVAVYNLSGLYSI